jgi:hypothetical protein
MGGCIHQRPTVAGDPLVAETVVELGPEHGISGASGDGTVPIEIVFSE